MPFMLPTKKGHINEYCAVVCWQTFHHSSGSTENLEYVRVIWGADDELEMAMAGEVVCW